MSGHNRTLNGEPVKPMFVDNLTPESHAVLIAETKRVNTDFSLAWGKRQRERGERLKTALTPETSPLRLHYRVSV